MESMATKELTNESLLSSYEASAFLQADPSSVNKWLKEKKLPAFRTPGGHHRIRVGDLVRFMQHQGMPLPVALGRAARRRLLVVDDDQQELNTIKRLFKPYANRLELRAVDRGIDALVQLGIFVPHVVLLDVVMPGLDGIEVCRRLRVMDETQNIKVIIMSAHLTEEIEEQAMKAGAIQCLHKPLDVARVLAALEIDAREYVELPAPLALL